MFFGRTDVEAETPILWSPHGKSWLIGKDSDAGRDWRQEEKGMTENEMAGWHHRLNGRQSEWTPGVGDGQGGLACCDSWGRKESDMTEWLNWTVEVSTHAQEFQPSFLTACSMDFQLAITAPTTESISCNKSFRIYFLLVLFLWLNPNTSSFCNKLIAWKKQNRHCSKF